MFTMQMRIIEKMGFGDSQNAPKLLTAAAILGAVIGTVGGIGFVAGRMTAPGAPQDPVVQIARCINLVATWLLRWNAVISYDSRKD